jgi:hypothetical protein
MVIDKLSERHVAREDFVKEIRRQVPLLQDWVISHNLLTLDPSKPLEVRATPAYAAGVAGASIDAPGPYRPQDRTYYNVTPLDGATAEAAESSLREYNYWILQILNIHEAIPATTRSWCTPTVRHRSSSPSSAMARWWKAGRCTASA